MIKWDLSIGCKDGSTYENQSTWYSTLTECKIKNTWSNRLKHIIKMLKNMFYKNVKNIWLKNRCQKWPRVSLTDDCEPGWRGRVCTANTLRSSSRLAASCPAVPHAEALSSVQNCWTQTSHRLFAACGSAACNLCSREAEWFCFFFPEWTPDTC